MAGLLLVLVLAGPASAKCCALDYMLVQRPNMDPIEIDGEAFEAGLEKWEQGQQWYVYNGVSRTMARPEGELGPGYFVEYVLHAAPDGYPLRFTEVVYPEAQEGPVAYVPPGQVAQLTPDTKPHRIDPGWRPYLAARSLLDAIDRAAHPAPWEPPILWPVPALLLVYWQRVRARDPYLNLDPAL